MKKVFLTILALLFFIFTSDSLIAQYSVSLGITQPPELNVSDLPDLTYSGEPVKLGLAEMVEGGSGQYIFHWNPEEGLDDPNIAQPMASPEEDVNYTVTVTDENGCNFLTTQYIAVDLSSARNFIYQPSIKVYPVPAEHIVHLTITSAFVLNNLSVLIYDIAGHAIMNHKFNPNNKEADYSIDLSDLEPGSYLLVVSSTDFISNHNIILL